MRRPRWCNRRGSPDRRSSPDLTSDYGGPTCSRVRQRRAVTSLGRILRTDHALFPRAGRAGRASRGKAAERRATDRRRKRAGHTPQGLLPPPRTRCRPEARRPGGSAGPPSVVSRRARTGDSPVRLTLDGAFEPSVDRRSASRDLGRSLSQAGTGSGGRVTGFVPGDRRHGSGARGKRAACGLTLFHGGPLMSWSAPVVRVETDQTRARVRRARAKRLSQMRGMDGGPSRDRAELVSSLARRRSPHPFRLRC